MKVIKATVEVLLPISDDVVHQFESKDDQDLWDLFRYVVDQIRPHIDGELPNWSVRMATIESRPTSELRRLWPTLS